MFDTERQAEKARRLLQVGHPGRATIVAVRNTGTMLDDNPEKEMELRVAVGGAEPYLVTHRQVISRIALAAFQPGVTLPVRVDPLDPANVLVP
jgi:hypothetical protein